MLHGWQVTQAYEISQIRRQAGWSKASLLQFVTGCGMSWEPGTIRDALRIAKQSMLRTVAGDLSWGGRRQFFMPVFDDVMAELTPWIRPGLWIRVGNEYNIEEVSIGDMYLYRWYLADTIQRLQAMKKSMPGLKIIAPGPSLDPSKRGQLDQWLHILSEGEDSPLKIADAHAIHLYDASSLHANSPQVVEAKDRLLRFGKPWVITEYGISGDGITDQAKGKLYATFVNNLSYTFPKKQGFEILGATGYHLCADEEHHPSLVASRRLLESYGEIIR